MRRARIPFAAAFALTLALVFAWPALPARSLFAPRVLPLSGYDTALVGIRPVRPAEALLRAAGGQPVARPLGIWRLLSGRALEIEPTLRRAGLLRYVEPDRPQPEAAIGAGDPLATPDIGWHLYAIGADQVTPPGPGVPITIVDSGLDMTHMEFRNRPDTVLLNTQPERIWDDQLSYHGTTVSSTAAAPADGLGAVGVYPTALLREFAVRTLFDTPLTSDIVDGIYRAAADGRTVINLSLAGQSFSRSEYEAIIAATRQGALVVAAAGNDLQRGNPTEYPASLPHVLTAGSVGRTNAPSLFSSSGPAVDLAAPGEAIPVQHPTNPGVWRTVNGTSFSAPIVAAAAAWVWTVHPELNAGQVADILRTSARDIGAVGWDDRTGYGLLDLPAALATAAGPPDAQEPNDDIDQVAPGRLFASGQPPITTKTKLSTRLAATIERKEDPTDVYRLVVPARRQLTVTVTGSTDIGATLWDGLARTVVGSGTSIKRFQLATSNRAGKRAEQVVYRNPGAKALSVYLQVWLASAGERRASYTVSAVSR